MHTCSGQTSPPPIAPGQLLAQLLESFKEALHVESRQRYGLPIALRHTEKLPEEDSGRRVNGRTTREPYAALVTDVCCRPIDLVAVPLRLVASHVGGNVYEIRCSIQEQSSKWAYADCVSAPRRRTIALGKKIATFCLSVIETHLGRLILEKLGGTDDSSENDRSQQRDPSDAQAAPRMDTRLLEA